MLKQGQIQNLIPECPVCLEPLEAPVVQCPQGHSFHQECISRRVTKCPTCRRNMTEQRNIALEKLLEELKVNAEKECIYKGNGCKVSLSDTDKTHHEKECRFRMFRCEGKVYANWTCDWTGLYKDLEAHFKEWHKEKTQMEYRTEICIPIKFDADYKDLHLISFFNGQSFFYYKYKVDTKAKKLYWTFQFIGYEKMAKHFSYEFRINDGPVRQIKKTEVCFNDVVDAQQIFDNETCVVVPFAEAKSFLNQNDELNCRFWVAKNRGIPNK